MTATADANVVLSTHVAELLAKLTELRNVEMHPGRGGAKRAEAARAAAEKLERRIARMMRPSTHLNAQAEKVAQRAKRLAKSKNPKERAQVVLGALDELPVDLAIEVAEEGLRRARARAGDGQQP